MERTGILETFIRFIIPSLYCLYTVSILASLSSFSSLSALSLHLSEKFLPRFQVILIYLVHFVSFFLLRLLTGENKYILLYLAQLAVLTGYMLLTRMIKNSDKPLTNLVVMLMTTGFIILPRFAFSQAIKQLIVAAAALVIIFAFSPVMKKLTVLRKDDTLSVKSPKKILRFFFNQWEWVAAGVGLLALLAVFSWGSMTNGSKLDIYLGFTYFQPSEIIKITLIISLSGILSRKIPVSNARLFHTLTNIRSKTSDTPLSGIVCAAIITLCHILILIASRDLGTCVLFFAFFVTLLFIATGSKRIIVIGAVLTVISAFAAYFLFSHVRVRLEAFLTPFDHIETSGYQISQSLFAIATGGWFGTGLTRGLSKKIPFLETDFIFAGISEELGLLTAISIILIAAAFTLRLLTMSMELTRKSYKLVLAGFAVWFGFQTFLIIGGDTRLIPLTGVTLPFISSGGSSLISLLFMFGLAQSLYASERDNENHAPEYMNRMTILIASVFALCFLVLAGNLTKFNLFDAKKIINNPRNGRESIYERNVTKGMILSKNSEVLAGSSQSSSATVSANENASLALRIYPYGSTFTHVVAYSVKGGLGLESYLAYDLLKSNESASDKWNNLLNGRRDIGNNAVTTLDAELTLCAYNAMEDHNGAVLVTEVSTGNVLVMISKPDFNPETVGAQWDELHADSADGVLVNRTTSGLYPPGSIFKIVTALAIMRYHPEIMDDYEFNCTGHIEIDGETIHCYENTAHGRLDFTQSFAQSCNSSFAKLSQYLTKEELIQAATDLGFGAKIDFILPSSNDSIIINNESDLIQSAIGQGKTSVTPLHIAMMTSVIANGGSYNAPRLLDKITAPDMSVLKTYPDIKKDTGLSASEATALTSLMKETVLSGTAKALNTLNVSVAGKTGSAEYLKDGVLHSHGLFTCFAPVDNPEIAVTVLVEDGGSGSKSAVPVAETILKKYFHEESLEK